MGSKSCKACAAGTYQSGSMGTACTPCASGTFQVCYKVPIVHIVSKSWVYTLFFVLVLSSSPVLLSFQHLIMSSDILKGFMMLCCSLKLAKQHATNAPLETTGYALQTRLIPRHTSRVVSNGVSDFSTIPPRVVLAFLGSRTVPYSPDFLQGDGSMSGRRDICC